MLGGGGGSSCNSWTNYLNQLSFYFRPSGERKGNCMAWSVVDRVVLAGRMRPRERIVRSSPGACECAR